MFRHALVLESHPGSRYADSTEIYEFPKRYRDLFRPLEGGEPIFAVIYEPRGADGRGRMAYIGSALISEPPRRSRRAADADEELWEVRYTGGLQPFRHPVPREIDGEPVEAWLRALPRGRRRNVATVGRAVRELSVDDLWRILVLAGEVQENPSAAAGGTPPPWPERDQRLERLVTVAQRRAAFREQVLRAYRYRCAVSGFGGSSGDGIAIWAVVEAAHIKPVAHGGPDDVRNGIALTPTLHALFDHGLLTFRYVGDTLRLRVSSLLNLSVLTPPDTPCRLAISGGMRVALPEHAHERPDPDMLRYHERWIFRG